jgi:hypothetical protein
LPPPEVVTALGPRPQDPEKAIVWDWAAGLTVAYDERWTASTAARAPSRSQQREQRAVETAKRAWTALRDAVS